VDVCLEQIKKGFAWHYKQYEREQTSEDRASYAEAERLARSAKLGLWTEESPIDPSQFRHK
jgi:endonuclease YncB( thermonuclease family)